MYYLLLSILFLLPTSGHNKISLQQDQVEGEWSIITEESTFEFKIPVLLLVSASGTFSDVSGTLDIKGELTGIEVTLTVDPASIDTGIDKRDKHLRSEDFFHVEKYPAITFIGNKIVPQPVDNEFTVEGKLTIKDVTREIVVPVHYHGFTEEGNIKFTGSKNINRREFDINYSGRGLGDVAELEFTIVAERK